MLFMALHLRPWGPVTFRSGHTARRASTTIDGHNKHIAGRSLAADLSISLVTADTIHQNSLTTVHGCVVRGERCSQHTKITFLEFTEHFSRSVVGPYQQNSHS